MFKGLTTSSLGEYLTCTCIKPDIRTIIST